MSVSGDASIIIAGVVAEGAPIMFAASGEYVAERAGTLNISITAMMLAGAYAGIEVATVTSNLILGLLAAVGAGLAVSAIHANFSHRLAANTFVVGLTLDALILGLTDYFSTVFKPGGAKFTPVAVPLLSKIPAVGPSLFDQPWPFYLLFLIVPLTWWIVERTRWGLELRACGENPGAADATGIRVNVRRRQSVYVCGLLSGLGGGFLSLAIVGAFNFNMTAGVGFVVIAAVIFGGWTLRGAALGSLLFGAASAMGLVLPSLGTSLNPQLLLALPYLAALLAMVFLAKSHRAPRALAQPFARGLS
ncbi:MAG: ABC transporter permease [Solirubrobacteraceae bacterium]